MHPGTGWLALNVYRRGDPAQTRLLAALAPGLAALEREGALRYLWCTRFDARGPHLFFALGTAPGEEPTVADRLAAALHDHLSAHPPDAPMAEEELRARHEACRGKALCAADRLPGMATEDSWSLRPHEAGGYPLHLLGGMGDRGDGYLRAAAERFHWAVARAAAGEVTRAALRWIAAADRELAARGVAEAAWRHHATTLLPPLAARLESAEAEVRSALERAVTPANRARFEAAWDEGDPAAAGLARRLADAALDGARDRAAALRAFREAVHGTLLLLGLPVASHVPVVLHAWRRHLAPAGAA